MTAAPREICVVDYGMGNLRSVEKALEHEGLAACVTADAQIIETAAAVILPGVGAFGDAMAEMQSRGLVDVVRGRACEAAGGGRPFLGICLGMQVLVDGGDEDPGVEGLGVLRGSCPRLRREHLKVPHMGWNALKLTQADNPLFAGIGDGSYFYFVHSFHVVPQDSSAIAAVADYGGDVAAAIRVKNLYATQFHPEKSQAAGLRLLRNFGGLAVGGRT
ncbi:imidazole glycerol phosphate synthase subunit HisH [Candidatus Poribacteria bacterium]|nr:imidazole glycerol phosphate synthase subunit HisH [Candidatus Poribacteria bacterium]